MVKAIRNSRVLAKLKNAQTVNCIKLNLSDSRVVEIAGILGFDCAWVDMEHGALDWVIAEKMVLAAKATSMDIMFRTERGAYNNYIKPLEIGASGIMIPHVMSADDAKSIASMTKFHPIGRRAVDGGNNDGLFGLLPFQEYISQSNEKTFVVAQIEDPEPLKELDEICSVPGIDMIFFGPGDFSQAIGNPGDFNNTEVIRARELVAKTASKHGKYAGTVCSMDNYRDFKNLGYNFLNLGADVIGIANYFRDILESIKE